MVLKIYLIGVIVSFILITANSIMKRSWQMLGIHKIILGILVYSAFSWFNFIMIAYAVIKFSTGNYTFLFRNWYYRFLYKIYGVDLKKFDNLI